MIKKGTNKLKTLKKGTLLGEKKGKKYDKKRLAAKTELIKCSILGKNNKIFFLVKIEF